MPTKATASSASALIPIRTRSPAKTAIRNDSQSPNLKKCLALSSSETRSIFFNSISLSKRNVKLCHGLRPQEDVVTEEAENGKLTDLSYSLRHPLS